LIYDAVTFTTVSLALRILSAIAAAALETSAFSIVMEEFTDDLATVTVGIESSY